MHEEVKKAKSEPWEYYPHGRKALVFIFLQDFSLKGEMLNMFY